MLNKNILNLNPAIVCDIISKAKVFHAQEGVTFSEPMPNAEYEYDASQILASHKDNLTYLEVKKLIEDLEPDQQIDLLTLFYVGRGDYDVNDWSEARKQAKDDLMSRLTEYLFSKPLLANYLENALEALGHSCEE